MLFLNAGFERTGLLEVFANSIKNLAGGSPMKATLLTVWSSGAASALFSNTAVALLFIPLLKSLQVLNRPALWSALILGTNLGGVTTPLSGSVCAVSIGMLKREGLEVHFKEFTKIGVLTTLLQLSFASLYLIIRFGLVI
jgi:Na+/H+ antiporter NhaD/arsenite permease-like protein